MTEAQKSPGEEGVMAEQAVRLALGIGLPGDAPPPHGADVYRPVMEALGYGVTPVVPDAALRERVVAAVAQDAEREAAQFEHIAAQVAIASSPPVVPRPSLREQLLANIGGRADRQPDPVKGLTFVKATEGTWLEMAPGVTAKVLFFDPGSRRVTTLVRVAAGAAYAPHRHTEPEEFYVLEGGCLCAGRILVAGDYHRAEAQTEHHDTSSRDGCLLLMLVSPQNELLP